MVEIKKEPNNNGECTICANAVSQVRWTIVSPSKSFFADVSAWVSQIAATKNIVKSETDLSVEMSLCETHNVVMNKLLPNLHSSKKAVLLAFKQIHEYHKH